ncbi:MAG: threonine aldolase family protein [Flavobacteriales bacterium]
MRIDLRSDTVTQPVHEMRKAMFEAPVGDDVFAEDPTVNELQDYAARMFGMEAALYCSSGTQTNQIAIQTHVKPGDEVICADVAHVYLYEGGGIALNAGASVRTIAGDRGMITANDVVRNINPDDVHYAATSLVCVENTSNKGGGCIYDLEELWKIRRVCDDKGLKLHCDGARLFNAIVAIDTDPKVFGQLFDSISICLSKGLGAPVGSLLLGKKDFMVKAHRRRKSFGGGMRQAGIIAAGGLYALKNHVGRLQEDHRRAQQLKQILEKQSWVNGFLPVETNIVIVKIQPEIQAKQVAEALGKQDIHCFTFGDDKLRLVTHLDFTEDHLAAFERQIQNLAIPTSKNANAVGY